MRQSALLLLPLLLLACKKDSKEPGLKEAAVHVQMRYSTTFKQGCIKVLAEGGTGNRAEKSLPMTEHFNEAEPALDVAVFRQEGWSRDVQITVTAYELNCDSDRVAARQKQTFSFAKAGKQTWDVGELHTVDEDGDGYVARDAVSGLGSDCNDDDREAYPSAAERCNGRDDNCDGVVDDGLETQAWYEDNDEDGFGNSAAVVQACAKPEGKYVANAGDCDDGNRNVHPDAFEACNGRDDNCNDQIDETFREGQQALDAPCSAACPGRYACNAAQTGTECVAPAPTLLYTDADGDGDGLRDSASVGNLCPGETLPPMMSENTLDCDDRDSATNIRGVEVCDGLDNDCDGMVDEGTSCGELRRIVEPALAGRQWRTVVVHPSGYPVWVAGMNGALAVKLDANSLFVNHDSGTTGGCPATGGERPDWRAAWVNPTNGYVTIAGGDGRFADHNRGTCGPLLQVNLNSPGDYLSGIVSVGSPLQTFAVSTLGHLFELAHDPPLRHQSEGRYWGLHSLGPGALYAVGTVNRSGALSPVVNQYTRPSWNSPTRQSLQVPSGYDGGMRAVGAVDPGLIFVVGDGGLVLRGSGQSIDWARVSSLDEDEIDYVSVVVPQGSESAYVVGNDAARGYLHRFTRHGRAANPTFASSGPIAHLHSIAMTSAGNFWIVGDDGHVYHFPEPPPSFQE
ncbi:BNR repeat domain protein [Myxococcus hansupus]|uniref:BNR repeat domain protein n=1 Tax=Pseudomyxococcus hansupus TaxID=1297742 RepID=A0A0H4X7Q0_9BACT|nr:putative metal-binding motif-containing protein [Myxococcus hansupus]AKQ69973.1 BNR repeat domain protein [Myxococcus hansupus]